MSINLPFAPTIPPQFTLYLNNTPCDGDYNGVKGLSQYAFNITSCISDQSGTYKYNVTYRIAFGSYTVMSESASAVIEGE